MSFKKIISILCITVLATLALVGCSSGKSPTGEKGKIKIGYVNWAEGVAMTNLAKVALEDKMGYEVELTLGEPGMIFTSLSDGNVDAFLDTWLPLTHDDYIKKYEGKIEDLGYNYENARIGLVVPEYSDINSIEDLNEFKDDLDGEIIGIDAGAGIMRAATESIKDYGLDYKLIEGSGPAMTTMLKEAIDKEKDIVVTGWKPHWKFARWDLKFLDDPKNSFGESENIHTFTRAGFKEDMPEVAEFFENFILDDDQLGSLMGKLEEIEDGEEAAREWMKENEDLVNSWIPKESK
ncbi:glycine betaine ABC transporter substrate-binding protein [Anaerosalibacter bizertensis]|uniref:glycine betaine ABC transporter substrate-binding protein n=1 Tax=Anaerosalibacter bizertensis TaxID=932217 RepID=UPI00351827B2